MPLGQTSPWKMNKPELTSTLVAMGIPVRPEWTVPELRSILSEQKEKPSTSELKGLSSLKLDQLIKRCKDLNIKIPEKPTRGLLMRMIRDGVPPTETEVVPFGRYRGYRFSEVPMSYLDWAIDECHNNENHSPDLARLARWAKENKDTAASSKTTSGYRDPEETAKKASPPSRKKKGRAATSDEDEDYSMISEAGDNHEKILDLEKTVNELITEKRRRKAERDDAAFMNSAGTEVKGEINTEDEGKDYILDNDFNTSETEDESNDPGKYDITDSRKPKVKLVYPDDYDRVKRLPGHKMKRVARKRVKNWAQKTLGLITTTLLAYTSVVLETADQNTKGVRDWVSSRCFPEPHPGDERVALMELFCGSAQLTLEYAKAGMVVLEPRDIIHGHDLNKEEEQARVIDEINTFRPELVWIALPCTLWGPWTRINYKDRPQELRRLRLKQKKLINLAIEAATVQIAGGNHVAFEHPRGSELWNKPDVKELLQMPHFQEVDFDMCSFGLKAVSDGGLLKKPTKVMCTDPGYAAALHRAVVKGHKSMRKGRPAKVFKPLDFNEEVAVDTLHLYDLSGHKVTVLSIMDVGSGYHVVAPVSGRKAEEYTKCFLKSWVAWAGAPQSTLVDQESGLTKDFPEELEKHGIRVNYTAGQAHWQNGHIERQNEWFRQIFDRVKDHVSMQDHEVEWVLASTAQAKNYLRRRHGYSPAQWLFGVAPRLGEGILDEEDDTAERQALVSPGDQWSRKNEIRKAAREAYAHLQASESLQRAIHGRPRVQHGDFSQGQYVYIYRTSKAAGGVARKRQNIGEWIGPGVIVGQEGKNFWVSRGGRCLLCAREHLRLAESEELGGTLQAKAVRSDLVKLIEGMEIDDEEVFADATGELAPVDDGGDLEYTPSLPDEGEPMEEEPNSGAKRPADTSVPEKRMRQKGYCPMVPEPEEVPVPEDQELLCYMASEKRVPRALQKQADKELKWNQIPEEEIPLYKEVETAHGTLHLVQHSLDNCLFLVINKDNQLFGLLATHADDILVSAPTPVRKALEQALSGVFPIDAWEEASTGLEYCGVTVKQEKNQVTLSQEHYVNTRLQTVDIPKGVLPEDPADEVAKMDNQPTIGALSWLASQTRPDIQVGVSMAQRKQKSPTYEDIKATNHVVRMAQKEKEEKLVYDKLGNWNDLVIIVYHDAAWANVTNEYDHQDYDETKDTGIYSQMGYVVVIAHKEVLLGKPGKGIVATWKSHACQRKRLLVDLAALRQMVHQEVTEWSPENRAAFGRSLKWIPTDRQLADGLTKLLSKGSWWSCLKDLKPAGSTT
ncbi:Copia protein [Durusdinium trenchii]|uniref:Copia protein n=1 Tax=Durusdinium trenchii TaxID=1381693 RepID=A0ABP0SHI6_9DINO